MYVCMYVPTCNRICNYFTYKNTLKQPTYILNTIWKLRAFYKQYVHITTMKWSLASLVRGLQLSTYTTHWEKEPPLEIWFSFLWHSEKKECSESSLGKISDVYLHLRDHFGCKETATLSASIKHGCQGRARARKMPIRSKQSSQHVKGCQIFLGATYQNGGSIPKYHKIYKMTIKCLKFSKIGT
jgi:hypothetical protein